MTRVFIKTMSLSKKRLGNNQKEHTIMKRFIKTTGWLAMAAAITLGTVACSSSDDDVITEQNVNPTAPKTYTMTVQVTKGDDATSVPSVLPKGVYINNGKKIIIK